MTTGRTAVPGAGPVRHFLTRPWGRRTVDAIATDAPLMHTEIQPIISMLAPTTYAVAPIRMATGGPVGRVLRGEFEDEVE